MSSETTPKLQIRLPLLFAITLAAGMFIGLQLPRYKNDVQYTPANSSAGRSGVLDEILQYIDARYVDSTNIEQLRKEAINHILSKLDPHSVYISPEELQKVDEDMSGNFEGIGVEFLVVDDTIQIVSPLAGGPSQSAGIMPGDKIVTINDTTVAGVNIDNAAIYKKLRGPGGSSVKIGIKRGKNPELQVFNIIRDVIPVKSVDIGYMMDEKTGYIKISRFTARTYTEFMELLRPMAEKQGLQNLVIDLRGNPGGYLNEAVDILSQFFEEGKLLVYTQGRAESRRDYKSNGRANFNISHVAVLIDEGSASASEIVAGAIQDHDRGWIVGRRSFGKGLVQEQYDLGNGGGLRMTVSRYYTPSGRSIQRQYKNVADYDAEASKRFQNGELENASYQLPDSTKYYTGMGRVVYAKGGISPDVFLPLDTAQFNMRFLEMAGSMAPFAAHWLETCDRSTLPANATDFVRQFVVDEALLQQFITYISKRKNTALLTEKVKNTLKHHLKAQIGRVLFQEEGLYRTLNADDPVVLKAWHLVTEGTPVAKR
jgi:carboxyl-terminal processing protease